MTKRVRKSRQSRKRNMYVGGGNTMSSGQPRTEPRVEKATKEIDKAFDKIMTPNITYWNHETNSPFAVFTYMDGRNRYTRTIPGIWGRLPYYDRDSYEVYKNFDKIYKDEPNLSGKKVRNTYRGLEGLTHLDVRPGNPYPKPPDGVVSDYSPYAAEVNIGGAIYHKYNEAINNPPRIRPGNGETELATLLDV